MSTASGRAEPVLVVEDLHVTFRTDEGEVHAVDGVDLQLSAREVLAVVGESGSGKSVTALSVLGLHPKRSLAGRSGRVLLGGVDLMRLGERRLRRVRGGRIGMIFQDAATALNPVLTVGAQLVEAIRLHDTTIGRAAARQRAVELLGLVGVADAGQRFDQYPHEFSGGMRQRAMIAVGIACDPEVIIADEPTTALDVTIQAQVLDQLRHVQSSTGAGVLLITHDLGVVAEMADRVAVMYAGRVVETAPTGELLGRPRHPYTVGLIGSLPTLDDRTTPDGRPARLRPIPGSPPDPRVRVPGCRFAPRCPLATAVCHDVDPPLAEVARGHRSRCHHTEQLERADPLAIYATEARADRAGAGEAR